MKCYRPIKRLGGTSVILLLIIGVCLVVKLSIYPILDFHSKLRSPTMEMSKDYRNLRTTRMVVVKKKHLKLLKPITELIKNGIRKKETMQASNRTMHETLVRVQNAHAEHNIAEIINSGKDTSELVTPKGIQPKVLILAYFRSGSSLTGSFFNNHPDTFYSFEPLHSLHKSVMLGRTLWYLDGRQRSAPKEKDIPELSLEIFKAFFSCNFHALDYKTLVAGFLRYSFSFIDFLACLRAAPFGIHRTENMKKRCIEPLVQKCQSSGAIVMKTIRARMPVADKLLQVFPDLKIIHLQRDPRGMACSLHGGSCIGGFGEMDRRCSFMSTDIAHKKKMTKDLQNRIFNIQYEAITRTPLKALREMFNFNNISLHQNVMLWAYKTLFSGTNVNGSMSLQKVDPLATAYKWTARINWKVVVKCQDVCLDAIMDNNYPRFSTIEEVRNFKLPITNRMEQKLQLETLLKLNATASPS